MYRTYTLSLLLILSVVTVSPVAASTHDSTPCISPNSGNGAELASFSGTVTNSPHRTDAVRITYDASNLNPGFGVDLPSHVNLTGKQGFTFDEDDHIYRYTEGESPYIEYRIGVEGENRQYENGENWIFAPKPTHEDANIQLHAQPNGVIGDQFLYIGNYSRYSTTVGCHEINIIVPSAGELRAPPDQILKALRYTASDLEVGHRYTAVRIFATPGNAHPGLGGFADNNEAWVTTSFPQGRPIVHTRIVLHEYIHTRQAFGEVQLSRMSWFNEGMAEYYSYKMLLDQGMITPETYNQWLENGSRKRGVLTSPDTWSNRQVAYDRGGAYLAILDAKIQATSNNSLEDVVTRFNDRWSPNSGVLIQKFLFVESVKNISNNQTAEWANSSLDSSQAFAFEQASASQTQFNENLKDKVERRIGAEPFAAVGFAFLFGMIFMEILHMAAERIPNRD